VPRRVLFCFVVAALLFLGLDISLKRYVFLHISPFQGVFVFRNFFGIDFSLDYVKNTGAAWGFLSSLQSYLLWGRCAIILSLLGFIFFSSLPFGRKAFLSWIVAGAFGNVLDFFIYGHVVDMFHFCFWGYSFAVFNIADSMIFCGVAALFIQQYLENRLQKKIV
jgi:signal peptidase II